MIFRIRPLRSCLFGAALAFLAARAPSALASDPLPGDTVAPALNSNLLLFYDLFEDADRYGGQPGNVHAVETTHDTHLSANITVIRYVRDFSFFGFNSGVQMFLPYITYVGGQRLGVNNLGPPAPGLPSLGAGHLNLSRSDGFAQPNFGVYLFPIADRHSGTYFLIGPWIAPPISGFNKNNDLNGNQNLWTFESEISFRTVLIGTPTTRNLTLVLWEENYWYLSNAHAADAADVVYANDISPFYRALGVTNPVRITPAENATLREQPTTEFRVYLPYQIFPATSFYVSPGLYQAFGGKQTYKLGGTIIDSGRRTEETQLRLVVSSYVSPTLQILLAGGYDLAAHGLPYQRSVEIRILKRF